MCCQFWELEGFGWKAQGEAKVFLFVVWAENTMWVLVDSGLCQNRYLPNNSMKCIPGFCCIILKCRFWVLNIPEVLHIDRINIVIPHRSLFHLVSVSIIHGCFFFSHLSLSKLKSFVFSFAAGDQQFHQHFHW